MNTQHAMAAPRMGCEAERVSQCQWPCCSAEEHLARASRVSFDEVLESTCSREPLSRMH